MRREFLDSLSFQYTNYILSDSLWITRNNLKSKVRFLNQNNFDRYIKKSKLFKIEDTLGVYLFLVKEILNKGFQIFIDNQIFQFTNAKEIPIHFVGSIAFYLKDELKKILEKNNLKLGKVIKQPIDGLVSYHQKINK